MIGMAGDDKNRGSLIVNIRQAPSEVGSPVNPDMGLVSACDEIISAINANDSSTLSKALKSFFNMAMMQMKKNDLEGDLKKGQAGVDMELEKRNSSKITDSSYKSY